MLDIYHIAVDVDCTKRSRVVVQAEKNVVFHWGYYDATGIYGTCIRQCYGTVVGDGHLGD